MLHGRNPTNLAQTGEGNNLEEVAAEMAKRHGTNVIALCGDLTKEEEVREIVGNIQEHFGSINFLICNAGGGNVSGTDDPKTVRGTCLEFDLADWKKRIDLQLLPTVLCCREVAPLMAKHGFGRIVTIGSIAACGGNKTMGSNAPYSAAKAAYGGERITSDPGKSRLEQIGKPEDIASLVLFLCGPGGEYISGQLIRVDGGKQLYPCCPRFSLRKLSR